MSAGGYATRSFPQSVACDGTATGVISFGNSNAYNVTSGAFAFWFKAPPQNALAFKTLFILGQDANNRVNISQSSDVVSFGAVSGGVLKAFLNLGSLNDSAWHHIVVSWGATGFTVLVDGNVLFAPDGTTNVVINLVNPLLEVGGSTVVGGNYTCLVNQIALCSSLLTVAQARAIYRDDIYPSSLSSFWNFEQQMNGVGNAVVVPLTSGGGNAGAGGASATWSAITPWGL